MAVIRQYPGSLGRVGSLTNPVAAWLRKSFFSLEQQISKIAGSLDNPGRSSGHIGDGGTPGEFKITLSGDGPAIIIANNLYPVAVRTQAIGAAIGVELVVSYDRLNPGHLVVKSVDATGADVAADTSAIDVYWVKG